MILGVSTKPCLIGFAEVLSHVIREHPKTLGLVSEIFQPTTCFKLICPLIVAPLSERESPTLDARKYSTETYAGRMVQKMFGWRKSSGGHAGNFWNAYNSCFA